MGEADAGPWLKESRAEIDAVDRWATSGGVRTRETQDRRLDRGVW
jgi:hypothetical protein